MAVITHAFESLIPDTNTPPGAVGPDEWNDDHDIVGDALTKADDTNVTLTLGGTPTGALLAAVSLTLGWTGTLAAARLNANVVQSVSNDTNVQGSIAAQALTLSWSGQLSIARGGTGQATAGAAFNALSPMTTLGDLIYGGVSGAATRRAIGTEGHVLTVVSGVPNWAAASGGGGGTLDLDDVPVNLLWDASGMTDGAATTFSVPEFFYEDSTRVWLNGLLQRPLVDYNETATLDGITMTAAPVASDELVITYLAAEI